MLLYFDHVIENVLLANNFTFRMKCCKVSKDSDIKHLIYTSRHGTKLSRKVFKNIFTFTD